MPGYQVATSSMAQRMDICRMEIKAIRDKLMCDDFRDVAELIQAVGMLEKWSEELRLLDWLHRNPENRDYRDTE